jgi:hypothetical protein
MNRELATRMRWTLARLGEIINEAREVGWIDGDVIPDVEVSRDLIVQTEELETTPLGVAARRLDLSTGEVDVLWLLACIELDPALSYAARHLITPGMNELSAQMVERILAADGALAPDTLDRLSGLALVETTFDRRAPLYCRPVRVHDGALAWARGQLALDHALSGIATLLTPLDLQRQVAGLDLAPIAVVERAISGRDPLVVIATGVRDSGRGTMLRHLAATHGQAIVSVSSDQLPRDDAALTRMLRTIARESRVHDAWPLLLDVDALADQSAVVERELLSRVQSPVLATASDGFAWRIRSTAITVPIAMPDAPTRHAIWTRTLPSASPDVIRHCAARYNLPPGAIVRASATAAGLAGASSVEAHHVGRALREHLDHRLAGLARRIETRQTWDDLVLPGDQFDLLIELVARVRHRQRVLDDWGFADKVGRGLGLAALLSGPPGTGKTMIAGLVANELGLDLYQVDLSKVLSKYIGETEKQLAALFEAAESGHAILLFDEADSLFAKRTDVKSSNDRYANLEVNYLLQRIEMFSGIALLTTNHETAIDQAFLRRLAFRIRVAMPEEHERELLWRSMIPSKADVAEGIDFGELARSFVMSGGYIKNAVLRAAFMCAELSQPISNDQLLGAARREYEGMGMLAQVAR